MNETVIGIVFDFDETLGPDTISYLLTEQGIEPKIFWKEVALLIEEGWDPPMAYMHLMLEKSRAGSLDLSEKRLHKLGKKLKLFPGLPQAIIDIKQISQEKMLKKARIKIEMYVISGGLEDMIRATSIAPHMDGIFGSNFAYDTNGSPVGIKSAISFTEKTRFLHGIRKGVDAATLRRDPYRVNDAIPPATERIPFSRIIYIGDGPSDIPSLSPIVRNGGIGIGAIPPFGNARKGYELARGKRITVGPYTANYSKKSDMRKVLEETILRIALTIDIDQKKHVISAPAN